MNKVPSSVWKNPVHFLAFGLGSGAAPFAPGTFGTLAAVIPYLWLQHLSLPLYLLMLLVTTLVGIWLCDKTSRDIGVHDHGGIVWDEFVGFWLTMTFAPAGWLWIVLGFVLFRIFDIIKPWPIKWADAVEETPPPTADELRVLRDLRARTDAAHHKGSHVDG